MSNPTPVEPASAWIVTPRGDEAKTPPTRVFGLSAAERLERTLARQGAGPLRSWPPAQAESTPGPSVVFRSDTFYDERLVQALLETDDALVFRDESDGEALAASTRGDLDAAARAVRENAPSELPRITPEELVPSYNSQLRKFDPAFVFAARPDQVAEAEKRIFSASYKGITDFITKHVFPAPALAVVRVLARWGVRPNTITAISYALAAAVIWLFARGDFGLGLLCAWTMTFLDTVDGKLARVTLTSSRLGGFLDHALDLVHPPFWWWSFAVGLGIGQPGVELQMIVIVGGYVVGRILEGIFLAAFGMEMFTWRPFDAFFRGIVARRNPNLLLLTAGWVALAPGLGYLAVAAWTVACLGVATVRVLQASAARLTGRPIRPWHEEGLER